MPTDGSLFAFEFGFVAVVAASVHGAFVFRDTKKRGPSS
jgi:hypothetical protein